MNARYHAFSSARRRLRVKRRLSVEDDASRMGFAHIVYGNEYPPSRKNNAPKGLCNRSIPFHSVTSSLRHALPERHAHVLNTASSRHP